MSRTLGDVFYVDEVSGPTPVPASTSSVELLENYPGRKAWSLFNFSPSPLFIGFGYGPVSSERFFMMVGPYGYYESQLPCYSGTLRGVWGEATGSAMVTQFS